MSILYMTGFESACLDEFLYRKLNNVFYEITDENKRTGNYSLHIYGSPSWFYIFLGNTSVTEIYVRVAVWPRHAFEYGYDSVGLDNSAIFTLFSSSGYELSTLAVGGSQVRLAVKGAGEISSYIVGGIIRYKKWNVYELYGKIDNTNGVYILKENGRVVGSYYGDTQPSSAYGARSDIASIKFGEGSTYQTITPTAWGNLLGYYDDIMVRTDMWPGLGGIEALSPTSDTAQKDLLPSEGTDNYSLVNTIPHNDATYVHSVSTSHDLYEMSNITLPGVVKGLRWSARGKLVTPGEAFYKRVFKINSTEYRSENKSTDMEFSMIHDSVMTNPDTETDWTREDIDNIEVGVEIVK